MEKNEIKKALYKEKPVAKRILNTGAEKDHYLYNTQINSEDVWFKVPYGDMGATCFEEEMPAQLLIRWIV